MNFAETPENLRSNTSPKVVRAWHATYALKKFCETHSCVGPLVLDKFDQMLNELVQINLEKAVKIGATIPTGGLNGSIDDGWINPVSECDDEASANVTFHALIAYWRHSLGNPSWPK